MITGDGRRFEGYAKYRKGSPENPLTREERHDKFRRLATAALAPAVVDRVIAEVEALDGSADLGGLVALCLNPPSPFG